MSEATPNPQAPVFEPPKEFITRAKRLDDALNLRNPDRIPVAPVVVTFFPTRIKGISNKQAMKNMDVTLKAWQEATVEYGWDAAPSPGPVMPARPLEILGVTQLKWPGSGLSDDQPFQWVEGETMMQHEYDEALADPNGYAVKKLWPRVARALAPLSAMTQMPAPPLLFLSNAYTLPVFLGEMLSAPPMVEILKKALDLAETHALFKTQVMNYVMEMMKSGYPVPFRAMVICAFDMVSDILRGMKGSMLDMYRTPEKLLALIEGLVPVTISMATMTAGQPGPKGIFIPMHRGAAGFMSDKQFAKFYWPGFKALINGIIETGLTPIPLFEGDYTPRLEYLQELPARKVMGHFDIVDRKKAKKLLGNTMVFWGNVPASLLCTGTPQKVQDDVKELIDIFGDNGGLIIDCSMGIPDEAKPENVQALSDAVHEFGVY
ncbi:MAG: hypothetical protein HY879_22090 [Deltaproteobacteria bacterium]|nr:hypothetical protein [Deltaproteobacteria bacterium]